MINLEKDPHGEKDDDQAQAESTQWFLKVLTFSVNQRKSPDVYLQPA